MVFLVSLRSSTICSSPSLGIQRKTVRGSHRRRVSVGGGVVGRWPITWRSLVPFESPASAGGEGKRRVLVACAHPPCGRGRHPDSTSHRRPTMINCSTDIHSTETHPTCSCTCPGYYRSPQLMTSPATKQRLIDASKMLLDIATESSDAFPPLKSCLGGISAIVRHCEVRFHRIVPRHC